MKSLLLLENAPGPGRELDATVPPLLFRTPAGPKNLQKPYVFSTFWPLRGCLLRTLKTVQNSINTQKTFKAFAVEYQCESVPKGYRLEEDHLSSLKYSLKYCVLYFRFFILSSSDLIPGCHTKPLSSFSESWMINGRCVGS